ncbi:A disintegrin and metalloproteinase with thrombospondin motifs 8-like isoform X3 [Biomphalaria glabrata]|nr:A disintegrin and metalloproteinase with thrombospondin motifs 8-like isoform X3 [Biomphalaria glabrata]XP_055891616.1 A disintegrin and metalloproteinase with thrombospondin motifs 8-like isoform X3 [Biomphalaria glabrata]XP_055891617.1 A disintegrin and metalloproteinase with thrombospondin motifs 8-like isoform X3 [Biomphalaria glabrata]
MGSPDAEKKPGTEYNPWLFSPCSVNYFTSFLKKKLSSSRGYTCLVYAVEASADIPDVSDKILGQVIKPDQQCQQFFGNDSFFCRASESRRSITEICQAMLCADVLRGLCIPQIALIGTSCGNGKVCINGQCVSDPYAPQLDENCAFGDRPSYSCSLFINDFMGNCYSTLGYRACCDTCNNASRPVKDCEQGDQDLRPELCTNISVCLIQQAQCCHYCSSYYTSATTSTTTTRPLIPSTSPKTKCEPGDLDLRPELCTNTSVCQTKSSLCCNFCSLHYKSANTSTTQLTSPNECVLGEPDLSPQLCTSRSICQTQPLMCCKYCSSQDNSASHLSLYTIWIYCFCIVFFLYIKTNVY